MQIHPKSGGPIRPEVASSTQSVDKASKATVTPAAAVTPAAGRSDKVQISDAGRALAAREGGSTGLSPERAAQIRQRVLDGAYNSLGVVDEVARRILSSGDL
jgi:anti-sigma28 factor (negative regulator of flagellin synthesis)